MMMSQLMLTRTGLMICIGKNDAWVSVMLDSYSKWLYYIILEKPCTNISLVVADLKDISREDTIKTYKEWLRVQGQLDDISNISYFPKYQPNYCYQSFTNKLYLTHMTNIFCRCI